MPVQRASITVHLVFTAALCLFTVVLLLLFTTRLLAGLFVAFVVFITFLSPRGLLFIQRYKKYVAPHLSLLPLPPPPSHNSW